MFDADSSIPAGPSHRCAKMRLSETSPLPTRPVSGITCLHEGVEALDLAMVKDFSRFYIATSYGRIVAQPTPDSITPLLNGSFCRLHPYHGHTDNEEDRSGVCKVSAPA